MTEKKKRGRPPGSGNKPKAEGKKRGRPKKGNKVLQAAAASVEFVKPEIDEKLMNYLPSTDIILPGNLGNIATPDGTTRPIEKVFKGKDGSVTLTIGVPNRVKEHFNDVANGRDEKPFPSNWNEMGKVQRLEWLTAHPRK
jgi:hypothetical protein